MEETQTFWKIAGFGKKKYPKKLHSEREAESLRKSNKKVFENKKDAQEEIEREKD